MKRDLSKELRKLGDDAERAEETWDAEETVTKRLPTMAPTPVKISAAFWDSVPRSAKAWVFVAALAITAALCAYALKLGFVPWFFVKKG